MMERFWRSLAVNLGKRAGLVSVIGLLVTLILGFGVTRLEFATGQESYLNADEPIAKDNLAYQKLFGGQAMVTLITLDKGENIYDYLVGERAKQIKKVADDFRDTPNVRAVVDPLTVLEFADKLTQGDDGNPVTSIGGKATLDAVAGDPSPEGQKLRQEDAAKNQARLFAIPEDKRNLDNIEWVKFILNGNDGKIRPAVSAFFQDTTHLQIISRLDGNLSLADEGLAATSIVDKAKPLKFPKAKVVTAGAPTLIKEINDYLKGGMLILGAIAVAIMLVILLVLFDVRWRLLPMLVILIGVTWAFGLAGWIGIPLNLVTIAGLPVMLGVGIDYAIQLHSRVEEEVVLDREHHPIQETATHLGPALLVVTFDAVFAFLALRWAKVPMIRDFGTLLAIGIAVICLCSIIVPLALLGIREFKSPTTGRDFREGALGRLTVKLGSLPMKAALPLTIASVLIFVGGIIVEDKLTIETDPAEWVNQSSPVLKDLRILEKETGSSSELGVFVNAPDPFDQKVMEWVHKFTRQTNARYPDIIVGGNSFFSTVADIILVPGTTDLVPASDLVRQAYEVALKVDNGDLARLLVGDNKKSLNVIFRTGPSSLDERSVVVDEIVTDIDKGKMSGVPGPDGKTETVSKPSGVTAVPSGLAIVGVGLLNNLEANRVILTYLSVLFVFLFLAVRMRSVIRSLLSLVPVLIAVGMASLVAWTFGLVLSPMTAVGGPLVVAACTEFTSLILLRFLEERRRGLDPQEAVDVAAARTGRAFIVSGLTAIAGVAVIASSSMPLLRDFGIIVAMNVAVALLSALVVLPVMLVWADQPGREWVSKGMVSDAQLALSRPGGAPLPAGDPETGLPSPPPAGPLGSQ